MLTLLFRLLNIETIINQHCSDSCASKLYVFKSNILTSTNLTSNEQNFNKTSEQSFLQVVKHEQSIVRTVVVLAVINLNWCRWYTGDKLILRFALKLYWCWSLHLLHKVEVFTFLLLYCSFKLSCNPSLMKKVLIKFPVFL